MHSDGFDQVVDGDGSTTKAEGCNEGRWLPDERSATSACTSASAAFFVLGSVCASIRRLLLRCVQN